MSVSNEADLLLKREPLQWAWSAHVSHVATMHPPSNILSLRRWDEPAAARKFELPSTRDDAAKLLRVIETSSPPAAENAVDYLLAAFRSTRDIVPGQSLIAVQLFNAMLYAAGMVKTGEIERVQLETAKTVGDLLNILTANHEADLLSIVGDGLTLELRNRQLYAALHRFVNPEPRFNYSLDPLLLLRHASGDLYQEAHLVLEDDPQEGWAGFAPRRPIGTLGLTARFTPPTLARALTEQALSCVDLNSGHITILDPACGSGVFLIEAVRELARRNYRGKVVLKGIDKTPISAAMAKFCLRFAVAEALRDGFDVSADVTVANSLGCDWTDADVILMNPPFVPWSGIDAEDKEFVRSEMENLGKGRTDLAMAFILRATKSLRPGGALATVLPSPLLDSSHGAAWREELARTTAVRLLGRFEGYSYFRASMVEPAFIVLQKNVALDKSSPLQVLIAKSGAEEKSLRSLRSPEILPGDPNSWSLYSVEQDALAGGRWMPRWPETIKLEVELIRRSTPRVGDLFEVRQGALTGKNDVFLLKTSVANTLPESERTLFRPAAGTKTIFEGRIDDLYSVFYPYSDGQLTIKTEDELRDAVPTYYKEWLLPRREMLRQRDGINPDQWWSLTRAREWQQLGAPKLISSYFGKRGGFAFDELGRFIVVHGYAWLWKSRTHSVPTEDGDVDLELAIDEQLAMAYLAILNSSVFEQLLGLSCPRVAGSQFNLSKRFVSKVFLPDLTDDLTSGRAVSALALAGEAIHKGATIDLDELEHEVAGAYRMDYLDFVSSIKS